MVVASIERGNEVRDEVVVYGYVNGNEIGFARRHARLSGRRGSRPSRASKTRLFLRAGL